jgi:hypothetical protein
MRLGNGRSRASATQRQIPRYATLLVALAVCGAGCAAMAPPTPEWVKTRDSADELERAREACKQLALAEVAEATSHSVAAPAGAGSFFKCMASKGWVQTAKGTPTPAVKAKAETGGD